MYERLWEAGERSLLEIVSSDTLAGSEEELVQSIVRKIMDEMTQVCDLSGHPMFDAFGSPIIRAKSAACRVASGRCALSIVSRSRGVPVFRIRLRLTDVDPAGSASPISRQ